MLMTGIPDPNVRCASVAPLWPRAGQFRPSRNSGQPHGRSACLKGARVAIQSLASERLKSTSSGRSTSERAIRSHDLEQTFANLVSGVR